MDEDKKRQLEELRKQIDPEVLSRMADYMGDSSDSGGSSGMSTFSGSSSGSSRSDMMRDRRASQFQQRMSRKKQAMMHKQSSRKKKKEPERNLYVLSHNDIWSRIVINQFKTFGFTSTEVFSDFDSMVRNIFSLPPEEKGKHLCIAFSLQMIGCFMLKWHKLIEHMDSQNKTTILNEVHYFLAVESMKQIPEQVLEIIGIKKIVCLTDDAINNREKINEVVRGNDLLTDMNNDEQRGEK